MPFCVQFILVANGNFFFRKKKKNIIYHSFIDGRVHSDAAIAITNHRYDDLFCPKSHEETKQNKKKPAENQKTDAALFKYTEYIHNFMSSQIAPDRSKKKKKKEINSK